MAHYYVLDCDFLNLGGTDCAPKVDDIDESSFVPLTRRTVSFRDMGQESWQGSVAVADLDRDGQSEVIATRGACVWGFGKVSI